MTRAMAVVMLLMMMSMADAGHGWSPVSAPAPVPAPAVAPLRVCADPNNLPFTNQRGEGFENRIADLLARDLGTHVEYTWWAQRRGFLRQTLNARLCDVVIGMAAGVDAVRTTHPYYRSTYVFVTRRARHLDIRSFDDDRLKTLRIGVPMVGDDGANAPPGHALARRGIVSNVIGFSVLGDYHQESPPSRLIAAVAHGDVDLAAAWGPLAGYFAVRQGVPLRLTPVEPRIDAPRLPFVFDIAMAVRRDDPERLAMLDAFLVRRRADIDRILSEFHVPRVDGQTPREVF